MRILFLTTDNDSPCGGCKFVYHLVDMLCENGHEAYALHQTRNFRYSWFENQTPVRYTYQIQRDRVRSSLPKHILRTAWIRAKHRTRVARPHTQPVEVTSRDLLVVPATRTIWIGQILPGVPKVTVSQGPYLLFGSYEGGHGCDSNWYHPDIVARITMSKLNHQMHSYAFPHHAFHYIPCFIDEQLFSYSAHKKPQIAYMPCIMSVTTNSAS